MILNQRNLRKTYVHSSTRFVDKNIFLKTNAPILSNNYCLVERQMY